MKGKKSRFIVTSLLAGTILVAPYTINVNNLMSQDSSSLITKNNSEAVIPWLKKLIFPVVKAGFKYGSNSTYNVVPSVDYGEYGDSITPGSIDFNSNTAGGGTYFDFTISSKNHSVNVYADAPFYLLFTGKITVILEDPNREWVINRSVNPTQWSRYQPGLTGSYRAIWIQNSKEKWTPYLVYTHNRGYISTSFNNIDQLLTKNTIAASSENKESIDKQMVTVSKYGNLIKPTKYHTSKVKSKSYLTAEELDQQFIDEEIGVHVYGLKDYNVGDKVYFKDTIRDIEYDNESNNTIFTFDGSESKHKMYFSGDLTGKYNIGEELSLKFKVESLDDKNELSLIDYFKFALDNNNKAPNINKYIIK